MGKGLPENWKLVKLSKLLARISNGANVKQHEEEIGLPITRIETIWNEKIDYNRVKYIKESEKEFVEKYKLIDGDILLSHINSDSHLGKTALFKDRGKTLIHGINLLLLRSKSDVNSKYLNYFIRYFKHKGGFYKIAQRAVNQSSVNQKKIKDIDVVLPPLPTQHRIVEKIEELFSELDHGMENLKKAQKQLKTYRQAVLKDAFEGKLTKEWREQQIDLPTPHELLQQIKAERKAQRQRELAEWEKEVEQWEKDGKPGRKPRKPREPKKLDPINDENIYEMPSVWALVKIGHVFDVHVGSTPSRKELKFWNGNINWVSSGEVSFCQIFDTEEKITNEGLENSSTSVHPPGTVMLGMIGEGKTRGQAAILKTDAAHNQNTAAIRVSDTEHNPKYVYHFLFYVYERTRNIGSGNNQKALNKERVRNIMIPFCAQKEQNEIVNEIESRLSVVDQLEQTIKENLQKADALRQSILKKAFSGELVKEEIKVEEAEITPFQQMQMIGVLINILKEEYDMAYGEMALAKYMFLIDRIKKYRTGFNFKDWHWGPYDPAIRKRLFSKQSFFRKNKEAHSVIELKENRNQLFKYHLNDQDTFETGAREVAEIISKFKGRKKTSRQLELLATVAKVVENNRSTDLQVVREGMKKWKTPKTEFKNKAEKFSDVETEKCLSFIKKQGWDLMLIDK